MFELLHFPTTERESQLQCISNQNLSPLTSLIKDDKLTFYTGIGSAMVGAPIYLKIYCGNAQALSIGMVILSTVLGVISY